MELRDIFEFLAPEKQEELEKIYGSTIDSWDAVENLGNVVMKEQKALISKLYAETMGKERCSYLKELDDYFYFCEKRAQCLEKIGMDFTYNPRIRSAQYNPHIDHFALQLWCMQPEEKYCKCINFKSQDVEGKNKKDNFK